ncbi:hypothetical protein PR002_g361 [Phytophthora rubi]|nr:hypothetical protein PR002_g361 [Phytophthora rubi]
MSKTAVTYGWDAATNPTAPQPRTTTKSRTSERNTQSLTQWPRTRLARKQEEAAAASRATDTDVGLSVTTVLPQDGDGCYDSGPTQQAVATKPATCQATPSTRTNVDTKASAVTIDPLNDPHDKVPGDTKKTNDGTKGVYNAEATVKSPFAMNHETGIETMMTTADADATLPLRRRQATE